MEFLSRLILSTLAVLITCLLLPGVHVDNVLTALLVAGVLAILNAVIKPILVLLTLPVTFLTFGFFLLIINALLVLFTSRIVPGFKIDGFWQAFFFGIVLALIQSLFIGSNSPRKE
ncbi:MAG: phage holin family protein [Bacteroidia bacterium]|nr:phage holin family protein [Bacteroidia bacterium]